MHTVLKIIKNLTFSFLIEDIIEDRDLMSVVGQILLWLTGLMIYAFFIIMGWFIYQHIEVRFQPLQHMESTIYNKYSYHVEDTSYPVTTYVNNMPIVQMQYVPGYDVYTIKVKNLPTDINMTYVDWSQIHIGQHISLDYRISSGGIYFFEKLKTN